jgi:hypothetical protein
VWVSAALSAPVQSINAKDERRFKCALRKLPHRDNDEAVSEQTKAFAGVDVGAWVIVGLQLALLE